MTTTPKRPAKKAAAPLLPAVRERAEKIRARGKLVALPPPDEMPPVNLAKIIGYASTQHASAADDPVVQFAMLIDEPARAWGHIALALDALAKDPKVAGVPVAVEFLNAVAEAARIQVMPDSAAEALKPLNEMLTSPGYNRGSVTPKVQLFRDLKTRYPSKGPAAIAKYISCNVGKKDPAVDACFSVDSAHRLIDRQRSEPVTVDALKEQIKKALRRAPQ